MHACTGSTALQLSMQAHMIGRLGSFGPAPVGQPQNPFRLFAFGMLQIPNSSELYDVVSWSELWLLAEKHCFAKLL